MSRDLDEPGDQVPSWEALHEEVHRLPERYRAPVVLCFLEGLTCESAAGALGWPVGTVKSRLARGRERLKTRLTLRNAAPSMALLGASPSAGTIPASAEALIDSTPAIARAFVAGNATVGTASPASAVLAAEVLKAMALTKAKLLAFGTLAASAVLLGGSSLVPAMAARREAAPPPPAASAVEEVVADEFRPYNNRRLEELGYAAHLAARYPEALRFYAEWSRRDPSNPKPHSMMGWSHLQSPNLDASRASFLRATQLAPTDQDGWHGLWAVAYSKGDHEYALRSIDKAVSLGDQRVNLSLDRALTKLALRDFSGAILDCDAALALSALDPDKAQGERDSATAREQREKARKLMRAPETGR